MTWSEVKSHAIASLIVLRLAASLGIVTGIVVVCVSIRNVHSATTVLVLLVAILIIAIRWGFIEAAAATGLGALALDYFFLPPAGWGIESPEHWLVFFTFLAVGLVTSHLAARTKRQAVEAAARNRELEKLYAFARDLPIGASTDSIIAMSLDCLVRSFESKAAAFCDHATGRVMRLGSEDATIPLNQLRDAFTRADLSIDIESGTFVAPIRAGGDVVGSLGHATGVFRLRLPRDYRTAGDRSRKILCIEKRKQSRGSPEKRRNQVSSSRCPDP